MYVDGRKCCRKEDNSKKKKTIGRRKAERVKEKGRKRMEEKCKLGKR